MGRRKMRRTKIKKIPPVQSIERRFACPKCHQDSVVQCRIMKTQKRGYAFCSVCEAQFMCKANNLTSPIDVYSEWVDECNARA